MTSFSPIIESPSRSVRQAFGSLGLFNTDSSPILRACLSVQASFLADLIERCEGQGDIMLTVLSFLEVSDVLKFKRVNKRWMKLCNIAIDINFPPRKKFQSNQELRQRAFMYCGGKEGTRNKESMNFIASTFGYPIGKWQVGGLISFCDVFCGLEHFNEDISEWDVSNAITMENMFACATAFNQDLSKWDTSNVKSMKNLFRSAHSFNQSLDCWDFGRVGSIENMFMNAKSFDHSISGWNLKKGVKYYGVFHFRHGGGKYARSLPTGWEPNVACRRPHEFMPAWFEKSSKLDPWHDFNFLSSNVFL